MQVLQGLTRQYSNFSVITGIRFSSQLWKEKKNKNKKTQTKTLKLEKHELGAERYKLFSVMTLLQSSSSNRGECDIQSVHRKGTFSCESCLETELNNLLVLSVKQHFIE